MLRRSRFIFAFAGLTVLVALFMGGVSGSAAKDRGKNDHEVHVVTVPEADRFTPFAITIHRGDTVKWNNNDTDDHTVVSDDAVNSGGPLNVDHLLQGTDALNGQPGTFEIRFSNDGTFVYYCRFHSMLDSFNQPIAPGPEGGIQGGNPLSPNNFGTPMMGVITVLPDEKDD